MTLCLMVSSQSEERTDKFRIEKHRALWDLAQTGVHHFIYCIHIDDNVLFHLKNHCKRKSA